MGKIVYDTNRLLGSLLVYYIHVVSHESKRCQCVFYQYQNPKTVTNRFENVLNTVGRNIVWYANLSFLDPM